MPLRVLPPSRPRTNYGWPSCATARSSGPVRGGCGRRGRLRGSGAGGGPVTERPPRTTSTGVPSRTRPTRARRGAGPGAPRPGGEEELGPLLLVVLPAGCDRDRDRTCDSGPVTGPGGPSRVGMRTSASLRARERGTPGTGHPRHASAAGHPARSPSSSPSRPCPVPSGWTGLDGAQRAPGRLLADVRRAPWTVRRTDSGPRRPAGADPGSGPPFVRRAPRLILQCGFVIYPVSWSVDRCR